MGVIFPDLASWTSLSAIIWKTTYIMLFLLLDMVPRRDMTTGSLKTGSYLVMYTHYKHVIWEAKQHTIVFKSDIESV